jgi:hypothetical protein
MLRSGDIFRAGKQGGVVGAFLKGRRGCIGVTAYHIMRLAKTKNLTIGEVKEEVVADWRAFDLVYFRAAGCEPTPLAMPRLGPGRLASALGARDCSISDVGDLISIVIGHSEMPGPGESGTPLYQDGKVVGILSSINLNTGKRTIISARVIEKGAEGLIGLGAQNSSPISPPMPPTPPPRERRRWRRRLARPAGAGRSPAGLQASRNDRD